MATSRQTIQMDSALSGKDLEANLSDPCAQPTAVTGIEAARVFTYVDDLEEICFFFALCGLWTNAFLHGLLVLLHLTQSASKYDSMCWSLATVFWGIVALSVHSMRHASRASKTRDPSNAYALSAQTRIAEALILIVFITWYRDAITQKTSPYKDLFTMCSSSAIWSADPVNAFYWSNFLAGIMPSQCDLATAIANVTWVGPIALLLAVWTMLFGWISTPTGASEMVPDVVEPHQRSKA